MSSQFFSDFSLNLIKVLSFIFQNCLKPFTMLLLVGSPETRLFRHLSNYVFGNPYFGQYISYKVNVFFFKIFKISFRFAELRKQISIFNFIWIGCIKLSLLRREYLSSAVNVLTNSPIIFHVTKRDFFLLKWLNSDRKCGSSKYGNGAVLQISRVIWTVYHVALWKVFWNGVF